ncbi:hypothetical protein [Phreatobacter cathodiphilus]|nr:hypothetical protein [Phreatobacter cathodiphilus]
MPMVNSEALLRALPVSALEPNVVARLSGWGSENDECAPKGAITLLEPPCGQREPYLDPVEAIEVLRKHVIPQLNIGEALGELRAIVSADRCVYYLDHFSPASPGCIRMSDFVASPWSARYLTSDTVGFLLAAAAEATKTPMFEGPDNAGSPWSLETLPDPPPRKAMMEFLPGAAGGPWYFDLEWDWWKDDWRQGFNPFAQWRDAIRPEAEKLQNALGMPVYRFSDPGSEGGDDDVHRFLVLHWCCTYRPRSTYVQYLRRSSGARSVEELKTALIDPATYAHDFEMNNTFFGLDATGALSIRYRCL